MSASTSTSGKWIIYSVLRLAIFVVVFLVLIMLGIELWFAGFATAAIGLSISYLFIPQPQRTPKAPKPDTDAEIEDAYVDRVLEGSSEGDRRGEAERE